MSFWPGNTLVQYVSQTAPSSVPGYVLPGAVAFCGIIVKTDNVNNVDLSLYDSTSNSGTLLLPDSFCVPGSANLWSFSMDLPLIAWNGIYVDMVVSGGGTAKYQILYDEG